MNIHLVLQGKGGVGKSFLCVLLAQYFADRSIPCINVDTDPSNASFYAFKQLHAKRVDILSEDHKSILPEKFDELIELIVNPENEANDIIIDSGSSCYIPFSNYLIDNDVIAMLKDLGHNINIHTIVTGGASLFDTLIGAKQICDAFSAANIYIWQNPAAGGKVVSDNKEFHDMKIYNDIKDSIINDIELPTYVNEFKKDLDSVLAKHMTFAEALNSNEFRIMNRQRIKMIQRDHFNCIDRLF